MEYSTTQALNLATFAGIIVLILGHFGVVVAKEEVTLVLAAALTLYGTIAGWIHRYKKGDITLGGFRK